MKLRRAARGYYGRLVAEAPYRQPPFGAEETPGASARSGTLWAVGCAAALAVMVTLPATAKVGDGSRILGARVARTIEAGVVQELGADVLRALAASPPLGPRRSPGGPQ